MKINYDKNGLVPAIVQDAKSKNVLMLGYMNEEAVQKTKDSKKVTFFSRSKGRLWTKGEESGNYLNFISFELDCDQDALLIQVAPEGPTCHKGTTTCWGDVKEEVGMIKQLEKVIKDRFDNPQPNSYVSDLKQQGIYKMAQKLGEEAVETVIEATKGDFDKDLFLNEAADLLFHYLILMQAKGLSFKDVKDVLKRRSES